MLDKFKDECGVFGIFGNPEAANLTYLGLYALQHRGQESAGIATADGERMRVSRTMGQVADAFTGNVLEGLPGHLAIGHTRYSTAGESKLQNAQPMLIDCAHGQIAIAHNGNIVNARELRDELVRNGSIFQTTSDTEYRGGAPPLRPFEGAVGRGGARRISSADQRRILAGVSDEESPYRGARSTRVPASSARQTGRRLDCVLGNMRPRPHRRHLRA
jgi:glutamate synthase domain-containing protein 1